MIYINRHDITAEIQISPLKTEMKKKLNSKIKDLI